MNSDEPSKWCARCHKGHEYGERCPHRTWKKNIKQRFAAKKRRSTVLNKHKKMLLEMMPSCNKCGVSVTNKTAELDHIVPVIRGGGNRLDNLQLLCKNCHTEKTKKEIAEGKRLRNV